MGCPVLAQGISVRGSFHKARDYDRSVCMSFLEDFEKTLTEKCCQNEPPFCQAVCPFRLDVKGMEEK